MHVGSGSPWTRRDSHVFLRFLHPTIFRQKSKSEDNNGEIRHDAAAHDYDVEVSDCTAGGGGGGDRRLGLVTSVRLIALTDISASLIFNGVATAAPPLPPPFCTPRIRVRSPGDGIIRGQAGRNHTG